MAFRFTKTPPKSTASGSVPSVASDPQPAQASYKARLPDLYVNWGGGIKRDLFDTRELTPRITALIPQTQPKGPDLSQILAVEAKSAIKLQGTLNGAALINNGMYNVGERVKGFTIVEILDNKIIVERQGVRLSITSE